jgi:hypothetical protein
MVKRIKPGIKCWFSYKGKGKAVLNDAMNVHRSRRSLGVTALIMCRERQKQPWVLRTLIYEGVKLERGKVQV